MKTIGEAQKLKDAIGARVAYLIEKRNLTQAALAEAIGSYPAYISRLINGKENPTVEKLTQIETALKGQILTVAK